MLQEFSFDLTFAHKDHLQGKKLKNVIDDYHFLTPGTTKTIRLKVIHDEFSEELDDGSKSFDNDTKVNKVFNNAEYKVSVIGYNPKTKLYQI